MSVKTTISLSDHAHNLAKQLVAEGRFPHVSAVFQHGLRLVEDEANRLQREEDLHELQIEALRAELARRASGEHVPLDAFLEATDQDFKEWSDKNNLATDIP